MKKKSAFLVKLLLLALLTVLFLSRMPALMHNFWLHSDESVFIRSARSMTDFLLGKSDTFAPTKYYPEGGFVLHVPFQLLAALFGGAVPAGDQFIGRVAGCFYFVLGTAAGLMILRKFFTRDWVSTAAYLAIMFFGLMHIEQSRYATGDTGSFLLIMLLIAATARAMETGYPRFFLAASALAGMLAAIKYPLAFFVLIPYLGFRKVFAAADKKRIARNTWKAAGCFFIGFFLLSPKSLTDPLFIFWTTAHETNNYMSGSNFMEVGGPVNHLISLVLYTLLYSGIPLFTGITLWQVGKKIPASRSAQGTEFLFQFVIPVVMAGFFLYNLFVTTLSMRTYYPFFCVLDLYCAALCGDWFRRKGFRKAAVLALCAALCLRGGWYLHILSTDDGISTMKSFMRGVSREDYTFITELKPGKMAFSDDDLPMRVTAVDLKDERFDTSEGMALQKGELVITTYQEYGNGIPYFLPVLNSSAREYIARWSQFKDINQEFRLGMLYPEEYYWLFGFWIKGTSGMIFEFPANVFYLNPVQ